VENASSAFSLSVAGDMNGDGFPELIIGAPYQDTVNGLKTGAVSVVSGNDLFLDAIPKNPVRRGFVRMTTAQGIPGSPVATFLMDFDGAPFVQPLALGFLDAQGEFEQSGRVPDGLSGHSARFQTFTFSATGAIIDTGREEIVFR